MSGIGIGAASEEIITSEAELKELETKRSRAEVEEAARAEWLRFWGNGVSYTPAPVQVFGGTAP